MARQPTDVVFDINFTVPAGPELYWGFVQQKR
jgi:hypothetical protein